MRRVVLLCCALACAEAYTLPDAAALDAKEEEEMCPGHPHIHLESKECPATKPPSKEDVQPKHDQKPPEPKEQPTALERWAESCVAAQEELQGEARKNMTLWCLGNCGLGNCPSDLCVCSGDQPLPPVSPAEPGLVPSPTPLVGAKCHAKLDQQEVSDTWCFTNCEGNTTYCPERLCYCGDTDNTTAPEPVPEEPVMKLVCNATEGFKEDVNGWLKSKEANDDWCMRSCNLEVPDCPETKCKCKGGNPATGTQVGPGIITGTNSKEAFDAWTSNEQKKAAGEATSEREKMAGQAEEAIKEHEEDLQEGIQADEKRREDLDEQREEKEKDAERRRSVATGATSERDEEIKDRDAAVGGSLPVGSPAPYVPLEPIGAAPAAPAPSTAPITATPAVAYPTVAPIPVAPLMDPTGSDLTAEQRAEASERAAEAAQKAADEAKAASEAAQESIKEATAAAAASNSGLPIAAQPTVVEPAAAQPAAPEPAVAQPVAPEPAALEPASTIDTGDTQPASSSLALSAAGYRGMAYL